MIRIVHGSAEFSIEPTPSVSSYSGGGMVESYRLKDAVQALKTVVGAVFPDGSGKHIVEKLRELEELL